MESYKALLKGLKHESGLNQTCCDYCFKEIFQRTYIKCEVCSQLNICLSCYSRGISQGKHQISHDYQVIDTLKYPLFTLMWTVKEEIMLLEGLERYGYGNWHNISAYISSKSPWDCESHYKQIYLAKSPDELAQIPVLSGISPSGYIFSETLIEEPRELSEPPLPYLEKQKFVHLDFEGYMPLRGDFEVEYENDLELFISDMEFYDDDRGEDTAVKLKQLHVYNEILDEREERKEFIINKWPEVSRLQRRFKNTEKPVYFSMKPFSRLLPTEKFTQLCDGLIQEHSLNEKIEELYEAHLHRVSTEAEFQIFIENRKKGDSKRFLYKEAEIERDFLLKSRETSEEEFCNELGINFEMLQALKDQLSEQLEVTRAVDIEEEPSQIEKFFNFIVKMKEHLEEMRNTDLQFRNPTETTPFTYNPQVDEMGNSSSLDSIRKGFAMNKSERFSQYYVPTKKASYRVGPGAYNTSNKEIGVARVSNGVVYRKPMKQGMLKIKDYEYVGTQLVYTGKKGKLAPVKKIKKVSTTETDASEDH